MLCAVVAALTLSASYLCLANENTFSLSGTVYERVGKESGIDPVLLYAITCVESSVATDDERYIRPYPWTLRAEGRPYYAKTRKDAERELKILQARFKRPNVDVGLAQINTRWHGHRVKNLTDLLDPYTNLTVAAQILNESMNRYPNDAYRAIGAYHSGDPKRGRRYARFVVRVYTSLKESVLKGEKR